MAAQGSEWANQATLNALLRFRPQREGLADLLRQSQERYRSAVQAGISEGHLQQQAAQSAVAPTKQIYSSARTEGDRARALMAGALAALPAGSPFAIAAGNEQAAGGERLAGAEAHALSDLEQRRVAGTELPSFTRQAAQAQLIKDLQALQGKRQAIDSAEGADVQSEIDAQRKEARKDALTERGQNLTREGQRESSKTSRQNAEEGNKTKREIAEEKGEIALQLHPNGKSGLASVAEQRKALGLYSTVRDEAKALHSQGFSRAAIIHALSAPIPDRSKEDAEGGKETVKGHPGYQPNSVMSAALDVVEHGGLTAATEARLRAEYLDPRRFGKPYRRGPVQSAAEQVAKAISF